MAMEAGQAGQIYGDDAAGDDEALYGGQPGVAAFLVGGLEHPVGLQGDRNREEVAQGQDHEHGEPERRRDRHEAVHALIVQGDGRGIERGFDHPAEGDAGVGEEQQPVNGATRERLPGKSKGGLFARVADPQFQEARTPSGPVPAGASRRGFQQQLAVTVVAEQIGEYREQRGQNDGEEGGARRCSSGNDGFPEPQEPDRRPPCGAPRLSCEERKRADDGNEQRCLHKKRNAQEPAAGHEVEQHALQGEESKKDEGTGAGEGSECGGREERAGRVFLPVPADDPPEKTRERAGQG